MDSNLRISTYEMLFPLPHTPGFSLAVNGLYGAYDIITGQEEDCLRAAQASPASLCALPQDTLERLMRRGHLLTSEPAQEEKNVRILSRLYRLLAYQSVVDLVILPTYNCNFRCAYCFERKRLEKGDEWLSRSMQPEMVSAIFAQMRAYQAQGRKLHSVILYGGEPFLRVNRQLVAQIAQEAADLKMLLVAITNGYELDAFLDLLKQIPFSSLQITVDGPEAVHDSRRYLAGGQGSYRRIMENIEKALAIGVSIHLRVNVNRSNLDSALSLKEILESKHFTQNPHFHYYFKATTGCFEDDPSNVLTDHELFEALYRKGICSETDTRASRVYQDIAMRVKRALTKKAYPSLSPSHCGASSNMLVVDPEGTLYTCWDIVSQEKYAVGFTDVETGRFCFNFNLPKWRTRTVDRMTPCTQCPLLMVCGGGCAIESEAAFGDRFHGTCGSVREAFAFSAPRVCEKAFAQNGERELSLSLFPLFDGLSATDRETLLTTTKQTEAFALLKRRLTETQRYFG
ncbi:MAG TPA: radical SAM protein [Candidatus Aphodomonas merdavium]|nr:radical SAM protein [Candidatus Aphodomonas merdavium]